MKRCTFKGTDEDIAALLDGLPSLLGGEHDELGFAVACIGRGAKNKFTLSARSTRSSSARSIRSSSTNASADIIDHVLAMPGFQSITVPALNSLFQEKHDGMLVRPCPYMSISTFIDKFGLDKNAVNREVFKALKAKLSAASRHFVSGVDAGQFWLSCYDSNSKKFTSFYEMVMMTSLAS